ncbi:MAG: M81 family peptidase [Bryobacterales bacterium]|nr:M81 family peptidase [Bryobacterales bacterium]
MARIGIAGLLHESNTYLPVPTVYEHFAATSLTRGSAMIERWRGARHEIGGFLEGAGANAVPLFATYAVPSGALTADCFERLAAELMRELEAALPLDGLVIALHGATVADNFQDADGEILRRLRTRLGAGFPIVATFDLHANISRRMAAESTVLIGYRTNPHLDQWERGVEAASLAVRIIRGEAKPGQALETPPMLIPIACQHTPEAPARGLYDDLEEVLRWPGILTASVAMGFNYADVEEMGASFLAVADHDSGLARRAARWMARRAWDRRHEFAAALPSPEQAVADAAVSALTPVVLMDVGDNVGGGSPGDSRVLFDEVLRQGVRNALVILYDPTAVAACVAAGVRSEVAIEGICGRVRTISDGFYTETEVRHGGWSEYDQGVTAVVETPDDHTVIFTSRRMAPMSLQQILSLGIRPERKRILIAKGVVAPRAAYEPVARSIVLVDTPGVTSGNPASFDYRHRRRPLYPLEPDAEYP